jgi:membrane protein YdbS with pleckstrin-like domain
MAETPTTATPPFPADDRVRWQPLPARARRLFVVNGLAFALPFALVPAVLASVFELAAPWRFALAGALFGAAFGAWLGNKHWKHTYWRLDGDGFNLRRGRLWRSETRVPASRVQHLDLKRGPLQRRYDLATLVIHTAGTRHSAVSVSGLDAADAERLRDQLAHPLDDDDDGP